MRLVEDPYQCRNLSEGIAERGDSDGGDKTAETGISSEYSQRCNATRNLRTILDFHRVQPMKLAKCIDHIGVVPLIRATTNVFDTFDRRHGGLPVEAGTHDNGETVSQREETPGQKDKMNPYP